MLFRSPLIAGGPAAPTPVASAPPAPLAAPSAPPRPAALGARPPRRRGVVPDPPTSTDPVAVGRLPALLLNGRPRPPRAARIDPTLPPVSTPLPPSVPSLPLVPSRTPPTPLASPSPAPAAPSRSRGAPPAAMPFPASLSPLLARAARRRARRRPCLLDTAARRYGPVLPRPRRPPPWAVVPVVAPCALGRAPARAGARRPSPPCTRAH